MFQRIQLLPSFFLQVLPGTITVTVRQVLKDLGGPKAFRGCAKDVVVWLVKALRKYLKTMQGKAVDVRVVCNAHGAFCVTHVMRAVPIWDRCLSTLFVFQDDSCVG